MTVHQGRTFCPCLVMIIYSVVWLFFSIYASSSIRTSNVSSWSRLSCSSSQGHYVSLCHGKETPGRIGIHCLNVPLARPRSSFSMTYVMILFSLWLFLFDYAPGESRRHHLSRQSDLCSNLLFHRRLREEMMRRTTEKTASTVCPLVVRILRELGLHGEPSHPSRSRTKSTKVRAWWTLLGKLTTVYARMSSAHSRSMTFLQFKSRLLRVVWRKR